jgi:hypothetical protein
MMKQKLRPTEIPEEVIEKLAASLGTGTDLAADLVVFMHDELRDASVKEERALRPRPKGAR